ncbi:VWA domain-containing protein [Cytobacillus purgationiresistens]|uniref:Magnesium chelatase subunit D n=1 Tax=Cytobacillus purgationiresistens TaxID=863449 RepID=A0ABU0AQK1_9BACI|nr:VWA domain-containing protein [Cytobacillus purgationiresistens]MDQ0273582.1 magnesium chelatase subunit D [Cytobacillus purgationiresistens]
MKRLVGQMKAKRGIAATLVNPYLDRVCIIGAGGTGKTTLLEAIVSYFPKKDTVFVPTHVTTEKLLGEKEIALFSQLENNPGNHSLLYQAKIVITDQFALMSESKQRLLVQMLKNKQVHVDQNSDFSNTPLRAQWFYCLDQENEDKSLLKHAKLCVQLLPIFDVSERSNILFTADNPEREYALEEIEKAKQRLSSVQVSDEMLRLAVEVVIGSGCRNQEADIDLIETARALAALDSDESIEVKHIEEAAGYTVAHRMEEQQESPLPESAESHTNREASEDHSEGENHSATNRESMPIDHSGGGYDYEASGEPLPKQGSPNNEAIAEVPEDEVDQMITYLKVQSDLLYPKRTIQPQSTKGKHREGTNAGDNGRMLRAVSRPTESISLYHTLIAATPYRKVRVPKEGMTLAIEKEDIRYKLKEQQQGFTILFLVDASSSIAAKKHMRVVKGAIFELLQQAYQKRDRIGMVTFRKTEAVEVLPFTNKFPEAKRKLGEISTGGKTPLAAGLEKALYLCEKEKRMHKQALPYLVILTDGNANETLKPGGTASQARSESYQIARKIAIKQFPVTVIDTQQGKSQFGLAEELATALDGEYISLDVLTDKNIAKTVQRRLHPLEGKR